MDAFRNPTSPYYQGEDYTGREHTYKGTGKHGGWEKACIHGDRTIIEGVSGTSGSSATCRGPLVGEGVHLAQLSQPYRGLLIAAMGQEEADNWKRNEYPGKEEPKPCPCGCEPVCATCLYAPVKGVHKHFGFLPCGKPDCEPQDDQGGHVHAMAPTDDSLLKYRCDCGEKLDLTEPQPIEEAKQ